MERIELLDTQRADLFDQIMNFPAQLNPQDGLQDLMSILIEKGDTGINERLVSHCFRKLDDDSSTAEYFGETLMGFENIDIIRMISPNDIEWLFLRHFHEIASEAFNNIVSEMTALAAYEGWEYEAVYADVVLPPTIAPRTLH